MELTDRCGFCLGYFFFQAEDGIRVHCVTGVQTYALPISELGHPVAEPLRIDQRGVDAGGEDRAVEGLRLGLQREAVVVVDDRLAVRRAGLADQGRGRLRSEERRVGKECRCRWWPTD